MTALLGHERRVMSSQMHGTLDKVANQPALHCQPHMCTLRLSYPWHHTPGSILADIARGTPSSPPHAVPCARTCMFALVACQHVIRACTMPRSLQAEMIIEKQPTFAEACAHPNAKRLVFCGRVGPVNVVEVDGTFFIEKEEALQLDSEVAAVATKAAASSVVEEVAEDVALDSEPCCSDVETSAAPAVHRISYAAAASKPPVGPKPSAAGLVLRSAVAPSKSSAGLKRSTPASQPAVVPAPLEVSICMIGMHVNLCRRNATKDHSARVLSACICVRQYTPRAELYRAHGLCVSQDLRHYTQPGGGRLRRRPEHPLAGVHHRSRGRQGSERRPPHSTQSCVVLP